MKKVCSGMRCVIHSAALMADADWAPKEEFYRVNVEGTQRLLAVASAAGVENLVYLSTVGVLGNPSRIPADESVPYGHDLSVYEWSKREAEQVVLQWIRAEQLRGTVLRLAQMYGPGMRYGWPQTIEALRNGSMWIPGRGDALLHLTHIDDVVQAIGLVLSQPNRAAGEIFNVAGPEAVPIREIFYDLADILDVPRPTHLPYFLVYGAAQLLSVVPYGFKPARLKLLDAHRVMFFNKDHAYDTGKAKSCLGFAPKISITEGFRNWILKGDLNGGQG
jgi:nucleoside-diphosphate-sugar epimerase